MVERGTGTIKGFDIVGIAARDAGTLIAFYRDVLGMEPAQEYSGEGSGSRGAEFELSDGATFGIFQPGDESQLGWGALFAVPDIKRAISEMRARGAELTDAMETPVCFMSFGQDPEGNRFAIHQRKPEPQS